MTQQLERVGRAARRNFVARRPGRGRKADQSPQQRPTPQCGAHYERQERAWRSTQVKCGALEGGSEPGVKLPRAARLARAVRPAECDHHPAPGESLCGSAGSSRQCAGATQQAQEGERDRGPYHVRPEAAEQPPPQQHARPRRAVRSQRTPARLEEGCVQERHLLESSGQAGRIAPCLEVRQLLLNRVGPVGWAAPQGGRQAVPLDRPDHEGDQLDFGSRDAEHGAPCGRSEEEAFHRQGPGGRPGTPDERPFVQVHMDERACAAVQPEIALDARQPLGPRRQGGDEAQVREHPHEPRLIGGVHEQVDVPCTGPPTVGLGVALPLTVTVGDALTRQRLAEAPHQRQQRPVRGKWWP